MTIFVGLYTGPQKLFQNFPGPQPKKAKSHWIRLRCGRKSSFTGFTVRARFRQRSDLFLRSSEARNFERGEGIISTLFASVFFSAELI